MPGSALLEVSDLSVCYRRRGRSIRAVDAVSFDVGSGETVGLVRESRSGKSSVARAILGLAPVTAGSIRFRGMDVTHLAFKQRREVYRHMQIVFQDPYSSLNPARAIGQTLAEPLEAFGEHDRSKIRGRVREMLERAQLPADATECYPGKFSGGQR